MGKAVMFLFKHPKEVKENKKKLEILINNWSRPIFNLDGIFKQLTKEDRQERDMEHVQQIKRLNSSDHSNVDDILNAHDKLTSFELFCIATKKTLNDKNI